jgi:16S rRNA (guanine(966)-N(2))-methyltransferase RsmD
VRIIGGEFRSRRLKSIPGLVTRPTPDRLRETLFDILGSRIKDAVFLDAYAGTGAVGIEALSRGAARAIFIERSKSAARVIRENLMSLGIEGRALLATGSAWSSVSRYHAGIVFLDPPYERESEYALTLEAMRKNPPELVIVQHSVRLKLPESFDPFQRTRTLKQGDNALSFYAAQIPVCSGEL